jgi:hypothetical protein
MSEPILCSVDESKALENLKNKKEILESCDFGRKWGGPPHKYQRYTPGAYQSVSELYGRNWWACPYVWTTFHIQNFADCIWLPLYAPVSHNPCGEISLGKPELCQLGVRKIATPFNLESFRELYIVDCIGFCKPSYVTGMLNEASRDFLSRSRQLQALLSTPIE